MEKKNIKKVSAIITTHNRLALLKRAINSVFSQTYKPLELIVVDDSSTDGTKEYCTNKHFTYLYIPKEESKGGNYARNLGIKAATGEYIAFLDDDDYWLPEKVEKQIKLIEEKRCELVYCGRRLEIINGNNVQYQDLFPSINNSGDMRKKILTTICTTTTNILVKKSALIEVGLFDESLRFWQEYELTIRLAQRQPFYFVNEILSVYRVDEKDKQRLTNKYKQWKDSAQYIYKKHVNLFQNLNIFEKLEVKTLYTREAANRAKRVNLIPQYFMYKSIYLFFRILSKVVSIPLTFR